VVGEERPSAGESDVTPAALELRAVVVELAGRLALDGVDLALQRGELVGLLGPNGAGKTTLLRAVMGLVRVRSGRITVDGAPPRRRRGIGYVPQRHEFAWDFPVTVEQAVMTGRTAMLGLLRRPGVADWQAVDGALDRVGLDALRRRPVGELSGGQRQRVLVGRALAVEPTTLLLDEPFTGLDAPAQEALGGLFASLAQEGRAVLMTTHDLLAAADTCDRLALLRRRITAVGPPAALRDPQVWMETFEVGPASPMLRLLEVI